MNPRSADFPPRRTRGSAFISVLMFTFILLMIVGSILTWGLTERRMNMRNSYWLEARNAAEGLAEYGFSQVVTQFSSYASPPSFNPSGSTPLALPPASFFAGSDVDTRAYSTSVPTGFQLIAGDPATVPSSGLFFVDPNNPNNQYDPLKGQWVYRRDIQIVARASAIPHDGPTITVEVTEKVSVRGAPLFANAIFYGNNDLEVFPGPTFNVYGPVHVNGNMWVSDSTSLNFHGPVSAAGNLYHAWSNPNTASNGTGNQALGTSPVNFVNAAGTLVNLQNSSGTWQDSTMGADSALLNSNGQYTTTTTPALTQLQPLLSTSFRQNAAQVWGGNLQTAAMGVQPYNPISFNEAIGPNNQLPDPHELIEPTTMPPAAPAPPAVDYTSALLEVEKQKYANQAALYAVATITPGTNGAPDTATIKLYSWPGSDATANGSGTSIQTPYGWRTLIGTIGSNEPSGLITMVPYTATATGTTAYPATSTTLAATGSGSNWKIKTTTVTGGTQTYSGTTFAESATSTGATPGGSTSFSGGSSSSVTGSTTYATQALANAAITAQGYTTGTASYTTTGAGTSTPNTSTTNVTEGLYDQRELAGINLLQMDMSALRTALTSMATGTKVAGSIVDNSQTGSPVWGSGTTAGYIPGTSSTTGWNGAVYIDVQTSSGAATQTSIALANGMTASSTTALLPTVNADGSGNNLGLTVATNAPMYILGDFNSSGANASNTSGASTPDDGHTDAAGTTRSVEIPVALAADAITILSPGYFGSPGTNGSSAPTSNGSSTSAYGSFKTSHPNASGPDEISAAFITGLVATSNSSNSGGVHNLPRFLETWGSNDVTIRGSLVSLYQSKIANQPYGSGSYYGAPQRNWGFNAIFQNGAYPPLTPKVLSFRRVEFTGLNAAAYQSTLHSLWPAQF